MTRKFIIDCDTGTDDAIALLGAFGSDEIEILGITSVNGNVEEEYVSQNNLDLCEYIGVDIPVCRGAATPLSSAVKNSSVITHGKKGLGSITLPQAKNSKFDSRISSRFLYEKSIEFNGELELLVTGPMTNIALTIIQYPEFVKLIKHLYFMGGCIRGGNFTTNAEFNFWADPEAAYTVINSGIAMSMVGLDVTTKAIMTTDDIERLRENNTRASNLTADLLDFMKERYKNGGEDVIMHDALALAAALYPECLTFKDYWMDVEIKGEYTRGHSFVDISNKLNRTPNVSIAIDIDVPSFRRWLVDRVNRV